MVMIFAFLDTNSFEDNITKTKKAKSRHIPMMVRKPKVKAVKRMGEKMFQKLYFLLRIRLSIRSRARMDRNIISISLVCRPQLWTKIGVKTIITAAKRPARSPKVREPNL